MPAFGWPRADRTRGRLGPTAALSRHRSGPGLFSALRLRAQRTHRARRRARQTLGPDQHRRRQARCFRRRHAAPPHRFRRLVSYAITLRVEISEQDKLLRKLLQSEKLAALGEALAGIAHEINNPLTAILCCASLLENDRQTPAEKSALNAIKSEAQRAADLIRSLLEFSRKETGRREVVPVAQVIEEVIQLKRLQRRGREVPIDFVAGPGDLAVHVCRQQLKQVLLTLFNNSEQAIPTSRADGLIRIAVASFRDRVQIFVSDNGSGIPPELQKQVFDPFFTTKAPGEGTGLGLSVAHAIIEAHGGSLWLADSTSRGTTFAIELPVADASLESAPPPALELIPPSALSGRILLVDDEPNILEALTAFLQLSQLEVRTAGNGHAALELLARENFDLVITDIRMPGMDGLDLYENATRLNRSYERRFIFMSGFLLGTSVKTRLAATGLPYMEKPFSLDEFRRMLDRALPEKTAVA
ncbi:MAG: ATP-binding protein [Opitutus sp.]|nr:ATP-binding protein [Opitutus sp.]